MQNQTRGNETNGRASVATCRWCGNRNAQRIHGFRIAVHCTCDRTLSYEELLQRTQQEELWERNWHDQAQ